MYNFLIKFIPFSPIKIISTSLLKPSFQQIQQVFVSLLFIQYEMLIYHNYQKNEDYPQSLIKFCNTSILFGL
ncbi:hypothetical protein pb186bvf_001432 [Paramecium bursaria]